MRSSTGAGIIAPTVQPDGQVRVKMGQARLGGSGIIGYEGRAPSARRWAAALEAGGREFEFTFVDMGNPHCVIETDDPGSGRSGRCSGRPSRIIEVFPNRTNVEFMKVIGPSEVSMRVWERGVGETSACGTGACAVAVAACRTRGVRSPVTVHLPGGDLLDRGRSEHGRDHDRPGREVYSGAFSEEFINRLKEL